MEHERRESKIIDELRLVRAVAKIRDVVRVRHVRFGDELNVRRNLVQHGAHELDDRVGLRQMDARRADFLPQIRYRVEPDEARTVRHVEQQRVHQRQQHARILHVHIHLIGAEGGPDPLRPARGRELRPQRQRAWPDDVREVGVAFDRDEEIAELRLVAEEALKPVALG